MFFLLLELLPYTLAAAVVAGPIGYSMPALLWMVCMSAAILILPPVVYQLTDSNPSHPGKMAAFFIGTALIFGAEIGLWVGYMFQ